MIAITAIARAEGVEIRFAVQVQVARTGDGLAVKGPIGIELKMSIGASEPIKFSTRWTLPVGVEETDVRLAKDIAARAGDGEVGAHAREGAVVGRREAGAAIVRGHHAQRVWPISSRETDSGGGIADVTREKQIHRRAEIIFVLEEEGALLGKVHGVSLIHGDQRVLGLNLAEIRIRGHVEREAITEDELAVHARLTLQHGFLKIRIRWIARVERAEATRHAVGDQFDVASRGNSFQPRQCGGLAKAALDFVGNMRPKCVFGFARDAAVENDSPLLDLLRGEAETLERDGDPDDKTAAGDSSARIPDGIERSVEVPLRFFFA